MKFIKARQPEIIRCVQKDLIYSNELAEDLSDILRSMGSQNWIRYHHLCKTFSEIFYHGFSALNNLQTLGAEYTGIIQIDSNYNAIPSKMFQVAAIILEFGGEQIFGKFLKSLEDHVYDNKELMIQSKMHLLFLLQIVKLSTPYLKAFHKTIFYFHSSKYQLSKRFFNINYILVRQWMQPSHSLYGYRVLGVITLLQIILSLAVNAFESLHDHNQEKIPINIHRQLTDIKKKYGKKCILCLEDRYNTSLSPCGHLFCWNCILEWLNERNECPFCRETLKKNSVLQVKNFI